ncbi:hypothetical protein GMORB2_6024 [Geosmithia morbida]|uniref:DUF7053 domain-containing protein n=1 Tax=Geosmithia morbida TaxID=1094350 RepID=A0A9P4YUG4_9HYPO|nr:uncharacterized protein GMORB2_6024 [Geosmithia morbida]KAF4123323.1 hypothetical protein GMORB2_6024 [Geosmithia morbida]
MAVATAGISAVVIVMRVQRQVSVTVPIPSHIPPSVVIATLQTISPVIRNLGTLSHFEETPEGGGPVANDAFFYGPSSPEPSLTAAAENNNNSSSSSSSSSNSSTPYHTPTNYSSSGHVSNGNESAATRSTPGSVTSYQIFELITLAPGLTKEVTYPAYFQRVCDGIRVRANGAAGITGWCEFTVRPRYTDANINPNPDNVNVNVNANSSPPLASPNTSTGASAYTADGDDGSAASPEYSTPDAFSSGTSPLSSSSPLGNGRPVPPPPPPTDYDLHEAIVVEANSLLMPFVCHTMQIAHRGLCSKVIQEAEDNIVHFQAWDQSVSSSFGQQ